MALTADSPGDAALARDPSARLLWLDMARTAALGGMIVFHFVRDLEMFALVQPGTTLGDFWAVFARIVAGSFLFLSGMSLVLSHREGFRPRAWARRLAIILAAAILVTAATRLAMPDAWVRFGILHAIAASSVLGLFFLRGPAVVTAATAIIVLWASVTLGRSLNLPLWLAWTGLGSTVPRTIDYIPLIPWFGPFLLGMAFSQYIDPARLEPRWRIRPPRILLLPGQHSLLVYLVHQPILIAIMATFVWIRG